MFLVLSELLHTDMEKSSLLPSSQREGQTELFGQPVLPELLYRSSVHNPKGKGVCCSYGIAQQERSLSDGGSLELLS